MNPIEQAIVDGRCALAVSSALLRDPEVMLALTERSGLKPMALAGPAVSPVEPVGESGIARAVGQKDGVLVLVEPDLADQQGLMSLSKIVKSAPHKPTVVVVARKFNPFGFGGALSGLNIQHSKGRGKVFIQGLPVPPSGADAPALPVIPKASKPKAERAAHLQFVGREEERKALAEILGEGGPVCVSGSSGVGRTWLVQAAIDDAGLTRLPEFTLGFGSEFDSLIARIAAVCDSAGSSGLMDALKSSERTPNGLVMAAVESLQAAEGLADKVMVVQNLQHGLGKEADFFRRSRLELLLEALLTNTYSLRLVFVSHMQPLFYREGQQAALRRMKVEGLKGRFLFDLFQGYKAPEFPRERFGPIHERTHGHAFAARCYAVAVRSQEDFDKLLDNEKFLKLKSLDHLDPVRRRIDKRLNALDKPLRQTLALLAHSRMAFDGNQLSTLRISRKLRLPLIAEGLLDVQMLGDDKVYRVHPLVRRQLGYREVNDFGCYEEVATLFHEAADKASDPIAALAWRQEANRCAVAGRKLGLVRRLDVPDQDARLDGVIGMIRGKQPRLDLAEQRLKEILKHDGANADAYLMLADVRRRSEAKGDEIIGLYDEAAAKAPVPEIFHTAANYWMHRRKRPKAIEVLQKGIKLLENEPRLHTRLANMLLRQGRRPEGLQHLTQAMDLAPMLPDAYGLLGQARREEGQLEEAEQHLREAVRLGADDPVQVGRLTDLLMARARVDIDNQDALRKETRELLDHAIGGRRPAPDALLLLATLVRETTGDSERSGWLLKKARKGTERGTDRHRRIQIEAALQEMASGNLDRAESDLRDRCARDPSDHRVFSALAHVLEAREQFVPAHAEYLRAKERAAQGSYASQLYESHLKRMQAVIEAQAAGLFAQANAPKSKKDETVQTAEPTGHQRVIRRKKDKPAAEESPVAEAAAEEPAAEESPVAEAAAEEPAAEESPAEDAPSEE